MNGSVPLSVPDLAPIVQGGSAAESFRNSLDLAQHAERWGSRRFWLAEHHEAFVARTGADELILASQIHDHASRLRSCEIAATVGRSLQRLR